MRRYRPESSVSYRYKRRNEPGTGTGDLTVMFGDCVYDDCNYSQRICWIDFRLYMIEKADEVHTTYGNLSHPPNTQLWRLSRPKPLLCAEPTNDTKHCRFGGRSLGVRNPSSQSELSFWESTVCNVPGTFTALATKERKAKHSVDRYAQPTLDRFPPAISHPPTHSQPMR